MANIRGGHPYPYIYIRDEKADGTDGGTFTDGAWRTRDLNTEVVDTDNLASLSANQITLEKGIWRVWARAPGFDVDIHRARVQNITDGAELILGGVVASAASDGTPTDAFVIGEFTITAQKVIELQHRCFTTKATNGFAGHDNLTLGVEVYAEIELTRIGFVE